MPSDDIPHDHPCSIAAIERQVILPGMSKGSGLNPDIGRASWPW
jgi:hypothetical protein